MRDDLRKRQNELDARLDAILRRQRDIKAEGDVSQSSIASSAPMQLVILDDGTVDLTGEEVY